MSEWDSAQYLKFRLERTRPAIDLANRIDIRDPEKIIDIGCGPGNSTQVLADKFPRARILGVDKSPEMIATAKRDYPQLDFKLCDVSRELSTLSKNFDVVFSNAVIQWIPDHHQLLTQMLGLLKKGGILAIQIPMHYQHPLHKIISEIAGGDKWRSEFPHPRVFYTLSPEEYFDVLSEIAAEFSMWETVYYHKLKSHGEIIEWYRGTGLRPYLNVLSDNKKKLFEQDILDRVVNEYPGQKNGSIIFRFPRLFFVATS